MKYRIKIRRDSALNWSTANPILAGGEPGLETDTGRIKYGDGVTAWNRLPYWNNKMIDNEKVSVTVGNDHTWVRTHVDDDNGGDYNPIARYDMDGNLFFATSGDGPGYISKYDAAGNIIWSQQFTDWNIRDFTTDASGDLYVSLYDIYFVFIVKLSGANGMDLWNQRFDSGYENGEWDTVVEIDSEGNLVGAATTYNGDKDVVLTYKLLSSDGSVAWAKALSVSGNHPLKVHGIGTDGNKNIYIGGSSNQGNHNIGFVAKIDTLGVVQWSKRLEFDSDFTGPQFLINSIEGGDLDVDQMGNVSMSLSFNCQLNTNNTNDPANGTAMAVVRLDSAGAQQWIRRIGPGNCEAVNSGVVVDNDGSTYISAIMSQAPGVLESAASNDFYTFIAEGKSWHAVAKYDAAGVVVWQRYLTGDGFVIFPTRNNQLVTNSTVMDLHDDKLAICALYQIESKPGNSTILYGRTYVAQLPADGTEQEMGPWKFTNSRIPGILTKFITSSNLPLNTEDRLGNLEYSSTSYTIADSSAGEDIFRAEAYEFEFDSRGSLVIPNDGEIRLTQNIKGFFNIFGRSDNDSGPDTLNTICVDDDGNTYAGGWNDDDNGHGTLVKYNPDGRKQWEVAIIIDEPASVDSVWDIKIQDDYLLAMAEGHRFSDGRSFGIISWHDRETGAQIEYYNTTFYDNRNDNDVYAYYTEVYDRDPNGYFYNFITGVANGSYTEFPAVPLAGSSATSLVVSRAAVTTPSNIVVNFDWQLIGTNVEGYANITNINRYDSLATVTTQGTGATFNIVANAGDPGIYTVAVNAGGTNYLPGHMILIPGTALGGVSTTHDLLITVATVTSGAIATVTFSGTANGGAPTTYTSVVGTNHNVGSGFVIDILYYTASAYSDGDWSVNSGGSNYVVGDVLTIPGTSLGGATPANNLTITVTGVDGGGAITGFNLGGTAQTTTVKLEFNEYPLHFDQEGAWKLIQPNNADAFISNLNYTTTFNYGDPYISEEVHGLAKDSNNQAYIIGTTKNQDILNNYRLAYVAKFDMATGQHHWTKVINSSNYHNRGRYIAINGATMVTIHRDEDNSMALTKMDLNGQAIWQRWLPTGNNRGGGVAIDDNGDIFVVVQGYDNRSYVNGFNVMKFNSQGTVVWRNYVTTMMNDYYDDRKGTKLVLSKDHIHMVMNTYAPSDYAPNSMVIKVPKDGTGQGHHGYFNYQVGDYYVNSFNDTSNFVNITNLYQGNTNPPLSTDGYTIYTVYNYTQGIDVEHTLRDTDGGKLWFADGSSQDTSGQDLTQIVHRGGDYVIQMADRGKHILCVPTNSYHTIRVPKHEREPMPIGSVVTIINDGGNSHDIYIQLEDNDSSDNHTIVVPGQGTSNYWGMSGAGIATLIKIGLNRWMLTGTNLYNDD